MLRRAVVSCVIACVLTFALVSAELRSGLAAQFDAGCTLPFDATKVKHDIDDECDEERQSEQSGCHDQNDAAAFVLELPCFHDGAGGV